MSLPSRLGAVALVLGMAALAAPSLNNRGAASSWQSLLAPYSDGTPVVQDFRIDTIRRGVGNDVVIMVSRPGNDPAARVEVHVLERGRWPGVRQSRSFDIAYETPHSPAAERETITELLAQTLRSHDSGLPRPDAIALGPGDPTVLPWGLACLGGLRGNLLGCSVIVLGILALMPTTPVALAALALALADVIASLIGVGPASLEITTTVAVPIAAVLIIASSYRIVAISRRNIFGAAAIGAIALVLRVALGTWGPLHVNGYGPLFVEAAARNPAAVAAYGPGYVEVFAPVAAVAPHAPDWAVFAFNVLLSSLIPVAAFVIALLTGVAWVPASLVGLLLAIDPVALRSAATESYFPAIILFASAMAIALLLAARAVEARERGRALACTIAAGLCATQAARIHPAAWVLLGATAPIVLAGAATSLQSRLLILGAGAAIIGGIVVITSGSLVVDVYGRMHSGALLQPSQPPGTERLLWVAGGAVIYALIATRKWLGLAAALSLAALLMTRHLYWQGWIWQLAYDRFYFSVPLIAAAALLPPSLLSRPWFTCPLAAAVLVAWIVLGVPIVGARTTDHLEYRWLRQQLMELPPECRIIHIAIADKRGLFIPSYVGSRPRAAVAINPSEPHTVNEALSTTASCLYYVRTSLCSSEVGRPQCDDIEKRLNLKPLTRTTFPALPSGEHIEYDTDPVEDVIAQVLQVDGVDVGSK